MSTTSSPPPTTLFVTSSDNSPSRAITDAADPNATWTGGPGWDSSGGGSTVDPSSVPPTITALLWLPYAIFTIVLLALIALSFVRFHCQRGHQYRRRQAELADKLNPNVQDALRLLPPDGPGSSGQGGGHMTGVGVVSRQPNGGAPCGGGGDMVPEHLNLFVQYSQVHPSYERHKGDVFAVGGGNNGGTRREGNNGPPAGQTTKRTTFSLQNAQAVDGPRRQTSQGRGVCTAAATGNNSKRPLLFTFNINGSMVDIRCGEEERTNTFRLVPDAELTDYDCTEEIDLGNGTGTEMAAAAADERHYHGNARSGKRHAGNHSTPGGASSGRHTNCLGVNYHHLQKPGGVYAGHGSTRTGHERVKDSSEDEELLLWRKHRAS